MTEPATIEETQAETPEEFRARVKEPALNCLMRLIGQFKAEGYSMSLGLYHSLIEAGLANQGIVPETASIEDVSSYLSNEEYIKEYPNYTVRLSGKGLEFFLRSPERPVFLD